MSQPAPRRRGRPRKTESEEARVARERALQRVRSQRYYERKHQQAVQPSLPPAELHQTEFVHYHHTLSRQSPAASSTDPSTGFHLESQLHIPIPDEDPLPVESTLIDHEPSGVEVDSAEGPCDLPSVEDDDPHTGNATPQSRQVIEEQTTHFSLGTQSIPHSASLHHIDDVADGHDVEDRSYGIPEFTNHRPQNPPPSENPIPRLEKHLAQEWMMHPSCSREEHDADHGKLIETACHRSCDSLEDVIARLDGLMNDDHSHDPLPHVTEPTSDILDHASSADDPCSNNLPHNSNSQEHTSSRQRDYRAACQIALEGSLCGGVPPSLCLEAKHRLAQPFTDNFIRKTYDVDSICSFPSSLAVARLGIQWYPQPHVIFNLTDDVHISLDIPTEGFHRNNLQPRGSCQQRRLLHHIPNYCFGRVQGLIDTFIWVFFPALCHRHIHDNSYKRTSIPKEQYTLWYDKVLLPAVVAAVQDPSILQYIPPSRRVAQSTSRARQEGISTECLTGANASMDVLGQGTRSNALSYSLQHRHLGAIWQEIQSRIIAFPQFAGVRLYMGAKNLKLAYMHLDIAQTLSDFDNQWNAAVDKKFLDPDCTFIDIGRQYTPQIGSAAESNVLIWRRCCLRRLWRQRQAWSRQYNTAKPDEHNHSQSFEPRQCGVSTLRQAEYPFVTTRDAADMTITPTHNSREAREGLLYSQFYNLVKIPFDAAKQYPFQNPQLEKMALDPSYLADCEKSTRGSHANQASLKLAYRLSKLRVRAALIPNGEDEIPVPFAYGVRAEDRLSWALLQRILPHLAPSQTAVSAVHEEVTPDLEPPFFAIQSRTMARFLHSHINRYCFLFEHIKSQTGPSYSLPETAVMAMALRSLRFSMSGIIAKEPLLWRDRWRQGRSTTPQNDQQQGDEVELEGLGLYKSSRDYGLGWWLPGKFDWDKWRFKNDVGDRIIANHHIIQRDYGRQWRVIQDIRDVHARMWQAYKWAQHYSVRERPVNRGIWLEYLYSTVIELFQCDVWSEAVKSLDWTTGSDLNEKAATEFSKSDPPDYCYDVLQDLFHDRRRSISHTRPYLLTGNKVRSLDIWDLVCDLLGFDLHEGRLEPRKYHKITPYRIAVRRSFEVISEVLGCAEASRWFMKLGRLLLLTHWILPWPSTTNIISTTKESRKKGLKRRLIWVSIVYATPDLLRLYSCRSTVPICPMEDRERQITIRDKLCETMITTSARRFGTSGWTPESDPLDRRFHWTPDDLLQCTATTLFVDAFNIGRAVEPCSNGKIYPLAERGRPPILRLVKRIRNSTLEELDQLFSELIRIVQTESMDKQAGNSSMPLGCTIPCLSQSSTGSNNRMTRHGFSHQKSALNCDQTADEDTIESKSVERESESLTARRSQKIRLHNVPNYCLGRVIGLADTFIWAFFPALFSGKLSDPYSQTCIPKKNFVHWYEEVMLPAIQAVVDDNNILQYIPKTHAIASSDCSAPREALVALAVAEEDEADMEEELDGFTGAKRRDGPAAQPGSRRKHFYVTLQSRYLAALWEEIHSRAALWPEYAGLRLYMAAKNTKLTWMRPTFESALAEWQHHWNSAVDEAYIDPDVTYIDIGRQMTPADTGPHGRVLIWRRCCMDRLWRRRLQWSRIQNRLYHREEDACKDESGKRQAPPIRRTTYPFVTLRDARDMTITPSSSSWELRNGLVYSQFYNLIKVPFDAAKQYPFQNRHTESMALDPSYLRDQRNSTRGAHAHQSRVQCAYRLSKLRIHRNVPAVDQDDDDDDEIHHEESTHHPFTYGIRAEDRVSLALLRRITGMFSSSPAQDGSGDDEEDKERDHPFFSVSSQTMARFLRASVNRYCFLFEYVKSQTGLKYSLPETVVMAAALRGLRFSYDCSLIAKESVLWGDRWTSTQRVRVEGGEARIVKVEREGLGLNKTSKSHGFGWWLPGKFDWNTWRFASDVGDRLAVGNDLLRQDYKRQWRVLKDIRDVHVRMWQAQSWLGRYRVQDDAAAKRLWLEYLHSTVIELFQRDVWRVALKSISWKTGSDVTDEASMSYPVSSPPSLCYDGLSNLFHDRQRDVSHTRPHLVAGNKIRSTSMKDLFDDLFSPSSTGTAMKRRRGWASLPYRIATRRSIELVEMGLGAAAATQWYAQLRRIVLLTHWILPWPQTQSF
ncbi:uncharacterized protein BKA55DRAFT_697460 [Fusarium redolens]|uniref:Uncharacterized protein n=1 Tax=Fusarium redolens TaxID=48865 RepID=A0A9P9FW39_FUSRE|nr:uncharacterized protein BKA55DRAFT_697460 [Fusarium redolens]KAH7220405.1 hypothetical protein BKA55DRAFT_697460 [Fusarium redolens]